MTDTPNITSKSWLMVATLGVVWGGTFLLMKIALQGITPFWLAAFRIGSASLLMILIMRLRGNPLYSDPTGPKALPAMLIIGALSSAIPFMLLSWGQQFVTSGFAGVSMAAVVLMVLPLAHFLVPGERIDLGKAVGLLIGFVGVVALIGAQAFDPSGSAMEPFGRLACLGAAACYALSSVFMRRLPPVDPIALATWLLIIGATIVIPVAFIVEGPPSMPQGNTLIVLIFLGIFPTALANMLRVLVIRSAGPTFMSLTNYLVPVCSISLGSLILGEALPSSMLWALALILSGVALSQRKALSALFKKRV